MPFKFLASDKIRERVERLEIPFNEQGYDPYGISQERLAQFLTFLSLVYNYYFGVKTFGKENIPDRSRGMLVGNHSGGVPADAAMVIASVFLEMEPPRLAQGMVEKFANRLPFVSKWFTEIGQVPGLPENCVNLLENERLLMVFPEGLRGVGKPYSERYELKRFGTGFMRLALETNTPIIPFAFVGGEEAIQLYLRLTGWRNSSVFRTGRSRPILFLYRYHFAVRFTTVNRFISRGTVRSPTKPFSNTSTR
ncbi:MAG: lysophospholipid acyltransferase family protein [bacterium]